MKKQTAVISFIGDQALKNRLDAEARLQGGRSLSSLLRTIIMEWIAALDAQRQEAGEDLEEWRQYLPADVPEEIEI